jgi:stage V sporulation protein SpoVS
MANRFWALAALAAIGAASPALARSETPIETFQALCVATGAAPQAVKTAAVARGYGPAPAEIMATVHVPLNHLQAFNRVGDLEGKVVVIWGEGELVPGLKSNACLVSYASGPSEDPEGALKALLNVGAPFQAGPSKLFLFLDDGSGLHRLEPNESPFAMTARYPGKLRFASALKAPARAVVQIHAPLPPP